MRDVSDPGGARLLMREDFMMHSTVFTGELVIAQGTPDVVRALKDVGLDGAVTVYRKDFALSPVEVVSAQHHAAAIESMVRALGDSIGQEVAKQFGTIIARSGSDAASRLVEIASGVSRRRF